MTRTCYITIAAVVFMSIIALQYPEDRDFPCPAALLLFLLLNVDKCSEMSNPYTVALID